MTYHVTAILSYIYRTRCHANRYHFYIHLNSYLNRFGHDLKASRISKMQLFKPLFALLCAILATTSPISTKDSASLALSERSEELTSTDPAQTDRYKAWNSQPGVPSGGLTEGVHVFEAREPRDASKDLGLPDIVADARNFLNANHYLLVAVMVIKRGDRLG